jgi:hypothetical protein
LVAWPILPVWLLFIDPKSNTSRAAFVHGAGSLVLLALERKSLDHGFITETLPQPIDRLLGFGAAAVDEVRKIGAVGIGQPGKPDADEPKHRAVGFTREQIAPDRENP